MPTLLVLHVDPAGCGHPLAKTMRPKIASLGKIAKEEVTYIKVLSPF